MIDKPVASGPTTSTSWAAEMDAFLARLPPAEASAVSGIYREKLDVAGVASQMSISVREVRRDLARGLAFIGRALMSRVFEASPTPADEAIARVDLTRDRLR